MRRFADRLKDLLARVADEACQPDRSVAGRLEPRAPLPRRLADLGEFLHNLANRARWQRP
jgi:hypothetical protein